MAKKTNSKIKNLVKKLRLIKAKDIMTKQVITTTENTSLAEVAELMTKMRISGMPVVGKKGKVVGLITMKDLFIVMDMIKFGDAVEEGLKAIANPTVKFAMSTEIIKAKENMTLDEVINLVRSRNVHTLPVFKGDKMVGIIGRRDVFKNFYAVVKGR
ncbi:MAG: CBS domain-containing protein [Candidatus Omnitrophica bacterium]|nr:CBS domain-containing protein [Candidatus Omnitrophota bacterium]